MRRDERRAPGGSGPGSSPRVSHGAPHRHGNRHPERPRIEPTADNPPASCIPSRWRTPGGGGAGRAPTADNAPIPAINLEAALAWTSRFTGARSQAVWSSIRHPDHDVCVYLFGRGAGGTGSSAGIRGFPAFATSSPFPPPAGEDWISPCRSDLTTVHCLLGNHSWSVIGRQPLSRTYLSFCRSFSAGKAHPAAEKTGRSVAEASSHRVPTADRGVCS